MSDQDADGTLEGDADDRSLVEYAGLDGEPPRITSFSARKSYAPLISIVTPSSAKAWMWVSSRRRAIALPLSSRSASSASTSPGPKLATVAWSP